ncbi:MAG: alpha-E domain-containing protein [Azonexaceae bacterium]|uniref:alpha-E domain-containing protein n=1 Tax=Azonexus sp. R2A61 TaxID=2744443 RepID=UPI001F309F7B|nr:alpha-E domain-containing protein [Azonexus sp. R2A61]MCE1240356.1 alpha-E domain-containing protein [Azonexaceae bacterium]
MLSRTADHLFWMSRYMERAENLARLLDVTWQMSLVPQSMEAANRSWAGIIALNSLEEAYAAKHATVNGENVLRFMTTDPDNFSSIFSCLRMARENAHAVRGTLTTEMWETLNSTWLEARGKSFEQILNSGITEYFEWVKLRSALTRGTTLGTLLQDESYNFIRLGTLLERADNTARILDVKYHVLPTSEEEGASDFYEWGALLRSVSAFEVYRKVYRDVITPDRVAELLILDRDMPRSLHFCLASVVKNLELIANSHSGETQRQAGMLYSQLRYGRIEEILKDGLHEWLTDFMDRIYLLGDGISKDFLVPMSEAA